MTIINFNCNVYFLFHEYINVPFNFRNEMDIEKKKQCGFELNSGKIISRVRIKI